jgi:hypothetical protein
MRACWTPIAAQFIYESIMAFWVALSEIIRNIGLVAAAPVGIYLSGLSLPTSRLTLNGDKRSYHGAIM